MSLKKLVFLGMAFWILGGHAQKDAKHPTLPKSGREMQHVLPDAWQVLSQASGDLNGDGYEDLAFAAQSPVKETIVLNDGFEGDTLQINPRILGIYFGKRHGKFKKALQSNTFIINRLTPAMDEPFQGLQILPNGDLQVYFYIWPCRECTSWTSHEYTFRYQNEAFELVGYQKSETNRVSGDATDTVIDFQNRTLKIISTTTNEEEGESEGKHMTFELKDLKTIPSLGKPFAWDFQQQRI